MLWQKTPVIVCVACVWVCFAVFQVCAVPYQAVLSVRFLIVLALLVVCAETRAESGVEWERVLALCAGGG